MGRNLDIEERIFNYEISSEAKKLAEKYGYSDYIVERYLKLLDNEAIDLLEANEIPMPQTIRCNDFLIRCDELEKRLVNKGFKIKKIPFLPHGYEIISSPYKVGATHEYLMGYYYLQDPGSMLVVYLMNPKKNSFIIDMASAPGGKSSQILQLTKDNVKLVSVELKKDRIKSLRSNLQRMGFSSYIILEIDARKLSLKDADMILLDSPSSGEGIIRKDPKRKKSRPRSDMKKIHMLQFQLLNKAIDMIKPEGEITYAACSTAIEEGEYVIDKILRRNEVDILNTYSPIGEHAFIEFNGVKFDDRIKNCIRLWPHKHGTEGFFICRLKKNQN
ncbi:tRNA/rRNA cytosine-C5-methylase [Caldisphaera lagunensis DSM 15908]|uniref:tRNA/rRNA cytosine-C5-methylase n=1 Tax=Caldisphaera lagunensis (strain DSM 15908 / JCM 11604 / ANMR 0165 / IC-154) TaxID=1056495 RepID=L0ACL5_CALLD|nr:RsmB/NOP family class I SAM-dependent RNA methyltransferase [Caldisphaera lagunensis]AFZ71164.1 tRNA/rRNA cytosine-C5-methylase [Caldisphaera lagunensis DSM 15908]